MDLKHSPAIVLRTLDYGDTSQIVTLFTRDFGRVKGMARAAKRSRRRFGGALEMFSHVQAIFRERPHADLVVLQQCDPLEPFSRLCTSYERICTASVVVEMVDALTAEREPSEALYTMLVEALRHIEGEGREEFAYIFAWRCLSLLGYAPQLAQCVACRRAPEKGENIAFSVEQGGVLCRDCAARLPRVLDLSPGTLAFWKRSLEVNGEALHRIAYTPRARVESRVILSRFIRYHLGRSLKSMEAFSS